MFERIAQGTPLSWPLICGLILSTTNFAYGQTLATTSSPKGGEELVAVGKLFASAKWDAAIKGLDKEMGRQPASEDTTFYRLAKAMALFEQKKFEMSLGALAELRADKAADKNLWTDYINLLAAKNELQLGRLKDSHKSAEKIKQGAGTRKLYNDAQLIVGQIALQEGRFGDARAVYAGLEKRVRNESDYPSVLWNLALSEKGLSRTRDYCQRLTRLYRDFPDAELVRSWGPFLDENKIDGKASLCSFSWEDLLGRERNLHLAGFHDRVRAEIDLVTKRAQGQKSFEVDRLEAQFQLQEGEVTHALSLLAPYYQTRKTDLNYLSVVAAAASRAGDSSTALGAYLNIHKLTPRTSQGRSALFQAAFLSYQYQDYDGAMRRFNQFLSENRGSNLAIDAEWHMAWIQYLKGNFDQSYKGLASLRDKLQNRRRRMRTQTTERVEYWMAMNQLRLKNFEKSRQLFGDIAQQGGEGYYAIAARERLRQVESFQPKRLARWVSSRSPASFRPAPGQAVLMAFDTTSKWAYPMPQTEPDSEDSIGMNPLGNGSGLEEIAVSEEATGEGTDQKAIEVPDEMLSGLSNSTNPQIVQRFERARWLISLGQIDLAKWELYEIERKTSNKDYLKALVAEYENIAQYHRSATIATHSFAGQRGGGIELQKQLWQQAYPQAYSKFVMESSKKFEVPKEMVWAIMRAESNYRRDAISPVGALGLMQVMPKTGQKISEMLGQSGFEARSLLEPPTAVQVGTRYLQRLSRSFEGNRALMAASYNAGPHRVKTWLSRFGNLELDEFIEHIPFLETRNYVKKVVSNYQVYSHLYDSKTDVFPELTQAIAIRIVEPAPMKETWEDI